MGTIVGVAQIETFASLSRSQFVNTACGYALEGLAGERAWLMPGGLNATVLPRCHRRRGVQCWSRVTANFAWQLAAGSLLTDLLWLSLRMVKTMGGFFS
jgi:hypothetical protein